MKCKRSFAYTDILNIIKEVSNQTFVELILISDSVKPKRVEQSRPIVSKQISRRLLTTASQFTERKYLLQKLCNTLTQVTK